MGQLVQTIHGLIDSDELEVTDVAPQIGDNFRKTATEWRLKTTGELVRRDVAASMLRGPTGETKQGVLG